MHYTVGNFKGWHFINLSALLYCFVGVQVFLCGLLLSLIQQVCCPDIVPMSLCLSQCICVHSVVCMVIFQVYLFFKVVLQINIGKHRCTVCNNTIA